MRGDSDVEVYVPNVRIGQCDKFFDSEILAGVICDRLGGCSMMRVGCGYEGGVKMGSGFIYISTRGICADDVRVEISCDDSVIRKHFGQIRRMLNDAGLKKVK